MRIKEMPEAVEGVLLEYIDNTVENNDLDDYLSALTCTIKNFSDNQNSDCIKCSELVKALTAALYYE